MSICQYDWHEMTSTETSHCAHILCSLCVYRILPDRHNSTHEVLFYAELPPLYNDMKYVSNLTYGTMTECEYSQGVNFWPTLYITDTVTVHSWQVNGYSWKTYIAAAAAASKDELPRLSGRQPAVKRRRKAKAASLHRKLRLKETKQLNSSHDQWPA